MKIEVYYIHNIHEVPLFHLAFSTIRGTRAQSWRTCIVSGSGVPCNSSELPLKPKAGAQKKGDDLLFSCLCLGIGLVEGLKKGIPFTL